MKKRIKWSYIMTALFSAVIIAVLIINVISTYRLASGQTEEMGRMRIEIIASAMQETLSEATHSLDRIGANFEQILSDGADSDEIRSLLSEEKKVEIGSTGRTCLNIFCITDGMCFTVSKILGDGETIVGIDYSMSAIQAYIEEMNSMGYGQAMIVNKEGLIVGYSDPELVGERLSEEAVRCFAKAIDAKDKYTNGHSERVAEYSREIARRAGMSESEQKDIYFMGLLHDVGKIGIPDAVINKPGKLTDEEFALIRRHPVMGYEILKDITEMPGIGQGARWHHERYGGGEVTPTASAAKRSPSAPVSSAWQMPMTP